MTAGSFPGGLYTRAVAVLARLLVPHGCLHVFPQHPLSWDTLSWVGLPKNKLGLEARFLFCKQGELAW